MSTEQIVSLLIVERDRLNRAIEAIQGPTKRRGRPPKSSSTMIGATRSVLLPAKKQVVWSAAKKKAQGERMRAYWAKRKKEEAKKS